MGGVRHIGALFFFVALAVVMTYPLVAHFASGVLGPPGDNFEYLYKLWWFKRALFDLGVSPFYTEDVFHPVGYHLALHEMTLANISLGMPLTILGGETVGYNALVLLSFVVSAFGAYLLALHLTRERLPALLAGVVYAFASYRMGQLGAGHLNLLGTQWLPLLILGLDLTLHTLRLRSAVLVGVFFALSALSSWYYAPMFAMAAGVYVLCRARQRRALAAQPWRPAGLKDARLWRLLLVSALISMILMAPSFIQTIQQFGQREMSFSLREVDVFSASLGDWFVPNTMHPLWGRFFASYYYGRQDVPEYWIALSWIALGLGAVALWPAPDNGGDARLRRLAHPLVILFIMFFILGLGTTLHLDGERVYLTVPGWIEERFTQAMGLLANRLALHAMPSYYELRVPGAVYVPLPSLWLYLFIPFLDAMRVWTRSGLVSTLALAGLAGIGLARLMRSLHAASQRSRRATVVGSVFLLLVVIELLAVPYPLGWSEVKAQPVDEWLAGRPGSGAVIQFPLWKAECGSGLYATTAHGKPVAYGYGAFFPSFYGQARPLLWGFPSTQSLGILRDWDVQYVLVHAQAYGGQWPDVKRRAAGFADLRWVGTFASIPVYHSGWLAESLPDFGHAFLVDDVYVYELT